MSSAKEEADQKAASEYARLEELEKAQSGPPVGPPLPGSRATGPYEDGGRRRKSRKSRKSRKTRKSRKSRSRKSRR
jgi:hypothetical protein